MKNQKKVLTGLLLSVVPFSVHFCTQEKQGKPNVLFILVDDLRPNLGCYGDTLSFTPNIDQLANRGVVFTRAYCQQAVCNPSRASLLTGLRPDEIGVYDLVTHFRDKVPDVITLPQIFKNNGYHTFGIGKVFHAKPETLDPISWSEPGPIYEVGNYLLPENQIGTGKQNVTEAADVNDTAYIDGKIANDAIHYLEKAKASGQSFFLAVGFKKPHSPYCAPKKYWEIYKKTQFEVTNRDKPIGSPDIAFHKWEEIRGYRDIPKTGEISLEKEQEIWHGYYACISYVDAQVGRILEILDKLDLSKNTIIVLWGDHGYHLGEQQLWCKATNFELDARVPLIISAPGMKKNGSKSEAIVETLDIYPTLIDLCKIQPQGKLSGVSLRPLLKNPDKKWKNVSYNQFIRPWPLGKMSPTHMGYSVRTEEWRCTFWFDFKSGSIEDKELYHLIGNSIEMKNLAGEPEYSNIEAKLARLIDDYKNGKYIK